MVVDHITLINIIIVIVTSVCYSVPLCTEILEITEPVTCL